MSLYTPVFPHTQPPPPESPSSSGSTSNNEGRLSVASYSSRLSELHLALATLPAVICPPSRESSPTSKSRSQALQSEIEDAVSKGRYLGDLCKTRYSRRGIASTYTGLVAKGGATTEIDKAQLILPDTEEEWFERERIWAEQRGGRGALPLKHTDGSSKTPLREKVIEWQAGVKGINSEITAKSGQQPAAPPVRTKSETATLGFPVVKRAGLLKDIKGKRTYASSHPILEQSSSHRSNQQPEIEGHAGHPSGSNPQSPIEELRHALPPKSASRDKSLDQMPPPSFPQDLPTSTPRNELNTVHDGTLPNHQDAFQTSKITNSVQVLDKNRRGDGVSSGLRNVVGQHAISTPPSPPASNYSSRVRQDMREIRPDDIQLKFSAIATPRKTGRPLTPVSVESEPLPRSSVLRTPEHSPLKKHRTDSHIIMKSSDGPSTPKASVDGFSRKSATVAPPTPDNIMFVDLASSKRSLPRPRPPKELSIQNFPAKVRSVIDGDEDTELSDASPVKSERSYFSSPGSGSSEPSPVITRFGANLLDSSPLGQFSQNPTTFAPMAESTQLSVQGRFGDLTGSPTTALSRAASRRTIPHGSSGILSMPFNSQYDVDGNIDRFSHILEKDVDFGAWINDAEDSDAAVEQLTQSQGWE